jgi:hypothetical protein
MAVTMKNDVFWDVAPCRSCVNRRFGGTYRLHLQGRKISLSMWLQTEPLSQLGVFDWWLSLQPPAHAGSSLADFSTLKMEAIRSSETSVHTRSTQSHIPEDGILQFNTTFIKFKKVCNSVEVTQLVQSVQRLCCRLDNWRIRVPFPIRLQIFISSILSEQALELTEHPVLWAPGTLPSGLRRTGLEVIQLYTLQEVKEEWSCTSFYSRISHSLGGD